ncbi:MAG: hypothetical protein QOD62_2722 [Actinomycetota bacterium]|jgi:hypothetical protein|nr:hypothetical protein [Actinomycetota bacterium]
MCRSIKTLRGTGPSEEEIRAAALQFVRKVSGYRSPSKANAEAFEAAVEEIAGVSARLLDALPDTPPPPPRPSSRQRYAEPAR